MVTGRIFNLQDLSVQDGPGIRTTVFLKSCPLRCAWCCNPEGQSEEFDLQYLEGLCRSCRQCFEACPSSAVAFGKNGRPCFRRAVCRRCLEKPCVEACSGRALRASGRTIKVDEILKIVEANKPYFENSGGGITLSGGEPLRQPQLARALVEACRRRNVSVGLETCGDFVWDDVEDLVGQFAFTYFDVKCASDERHRRFTGRSNAPILANLKRLAARKSPRLTITLTLVPGFNDNPREWAAVAKLCRDNGLKRVRLLAYHDLGREKYRSLGRRYSLREGLELGKTVKSDCARFLRSRGLTIERD